MVEHKPQMYVVHDYQQHAQSAQDINAVQPEAAGFIRLSASSVHSLEEYPANAAQRNDARLGPPPISAGNSAAASSLEISRKLGQPTEVLRAVLHDHPRAIIRDQVLETIH